MRLWRSGLVWGVLLGAALLTGLHRPMWRDDLALWTAAAVSSPANPRATFNLGLAALHNGQYRTACYWFERTRANVETSTRAYDRAVVLGLVDKNETWITAYTDTACD